MKNVQISAVIITYNEDENIGRCLDSLSNVADEIIVVDSFSQDRTKEICLKKGVKFIQHAFEGHIEQKNYAVNQALNDIILSLDADEALSGELCENILNIKSQWEADGYEINRLTSYCGKWIRHCGWYPDRKIRLWDRNKGKWGGVNPHDKVIMKQDVAVKKIKGDILHYSFPTIQSHIDTLSKFSEIAAQEAVKNNKKINVLVHIVFNPIFTFLNKFFIKLGFLDGYYGFVICAISGFANFVKYTKIRELKKKQLS